jgi:Tfp pilus assembly protein PilF
LKRYLKSGKRGDADACNCAALIMEQENPIQAVDLYKRALEIDENHSDAMVNMALLYYNKKEE